MTSNRTEHGLLADKVVLVTGASTGIGAAAARLFAREGASVFLTARSAERLAEVADEITEAGGVASYVVGDISAADDVERVVEAVLRRHGRLDGAFNNAGMSQGGGMLVEIDEQRFDRLFAVNVKGVWLAMRAEIRALLAAGRPGSIVNTSSVGGLRGGAGLGAYSASKHAVIGLTRTAAQEYGAHGVRVNVIAPGTTDTPMIAAWKRREPDITERLNAATPLGRGAHPTEVAQAAAWLLSDQASYVSGAMLTVDGGLTA
jgi:NAD(P)-dependent dehydrogenase (short-subunit alcohol dehydrogenase family)